MKRLYYRFDTVVTISDLIYNCDMSNTKTRNKTKGLIALAVYSLMFRKDYDSITVKEICEKAGISRMSFYRYYNKKDDIFVNYCDERFEEFYESIHSMKDISVHDFTLKMFQFIYKYKRQIKVLKKANREFMLLDQLNSYAKFILSNMKDNDEVEKKNNPLLAPFIAGGLFNVLMIWVDSEKQASPEEINDMLYSILASR